MSPSLIPLIILSAIIVSLIIFIYIAHRASVRIISTKQIDDLGLFKDYSDRCEYEIRGPWGICQFSDYNKLDLNTVKSLVSQLAHNYDTILPKLESAISEAKNIAGSSASGWVLNSVQIMDSSKKFILYIGIPNCPLLNWGIEIELVNWNVANWELPH